MPPGKAAGSHGIGRLSSPLWHPRDRQAGQNTNISPAGVEVKHDTF